MYRDICEVASCTKPRIAYSEVMPGYDVSLWATDKADIFIMI